MTIRYSVVLPFGIIWLPKKKQPFHMQSFIRFIADLVDFLRTAIVLSSVGLLVSIFIIYCTQSRKGWFIAEAIFLTSVSIGILWGIEAWRKKYKSTRARQL